MKRDFSMKLVTAAVLVLMLPAWLIAEEFKIQVRPSGRTANLKIVETPTANHLDLRELAAVVGGGLEWEISAERITWVLDGVPLTFEDRLAFFTSGEKSYQLIAGCRIHAGRFLVPVQLAVEYLPRLFPGRFSFNKLENQMVDKGSKKSPPRADSCGPNCRRSAPSPGSRIS